MKSTRISRSFIAYAALLTFILAFFIFSILHKSGRQYSGYSKMLMGTVVEVLIMDGDRSQFDEAARSAFDEVARLEKILSSYIPGSDVSRISASAGKGPVKVSSETIRVVKEALTAARLTRGAFDPTVGALARIWGFSGEKRRVPSGEEVKKLLPLVNYRKVVVDEKEDTVTLKGGGMTLNLGGVAKGFIVQKAMEAMKRHGVTRAIIKAGGDMVLYDGRPDIVRTSFIIGIRDPRNEKKILGEIYVDGGAVATSGDYERFFLKNGKRYHHILDPRTGWPAGLSRSVTIMARDSTLADALSTGVFVLGPSDGMRLVESLPDVECVIVDSKGQVHISSGFRGRIF